MNKNFKNRGLDNEVSVTTTNVSIESGGKTGGCVQVSGSTKRITLSRRPYMSPRGDNEMSVSIWVKASSFSYIIAFGSFELRLLANLAQFRTGGGSAPYTVTAQVSGTYNTGTWYHLCGTWSAKEGRIRIYVNGVLGAETYAVPGEYQSPSSAMNLVYSGDWYISDFRIYDNEITEEDVKDLYRGKVFEFTPQWENNERLFDASGFNFPLTPCAMTYSNNLAHFNGTSSHIQFKGLNLTGGTVSIWFNLPAKPSVQRILYYDPTSKMCVGFLSDGLILGAANGTNKNSRQSTGITWGQLNNITCVWGTDRFPSALYVNGVIPGTGRTSTWSTGGTVGAIGRRIGVSNGDNYLSGSVNEVKVFTSQLTQAEVQSLCNAGPCSNVWGEHASLDGAYYSYSGCSWMKVLHHNTPATKLFTAANGKNNNDKDLYSRLGLFDSNTNFRMANGKYEFMVREKLESTSTENQATWIQTSSPTANTIAGYQLLNSGPTAAPRNFGLTHQSANAVFDDSGTSTWWCACGCNTAYQGGIPAFWGNCKTGYLDLYIRVDDTKYLGAAAVPSEYTVLQYIEATGTQWIDTELTGFDTEDWEIFCEWKITSAPAAAYAYVFGVYEAEANNTYRLITNQKSTTDYYVNPDSKAGGGSISVTGLATASTHTVLIKGKGSFLVNGTSYSSGTYGTAVPNGNTMGLFRTRLSGGTFTNFFKGRIYAFWAKKGGVYRANIVPVKRNSDNAVGMYDTTRKMFLPNAGTGTFTAGPAVTNL